MTDQISLGEEKESRGGKETNLKDISMMKKKKNCILMFSR